MWTNHSRVRCGSGCGVSSGTCGIRGCCLLPAVLLGPVCKAGVQQVVACVRFRISPMLKIVESLEGTWASGAEGFQRCLEGALLTPRQPLEVLFHYRLRDTLRNPELDAGETVGRRGAGVGDGVWGQQDWSQCSYGFKWLHNEVVQVLGVCLGVLSHMQHLLLKILKI